MFRELDLMLSPSALRHKISLYIVSLNFLGQYSDSAYQIIISALILHASEIITRPFILSEILFRLVDPRGPYGTRFVTKIRRLSWAQDKEFPEILAYSGPR